MHLRTFTSRWMIGVALCFLCCQLAQSPLPIPTASNEAFPSPADVWNTPVNWGQNGSTTFRSTLTQTANTTFASQHLTDNTMAASHPDWTLTDARVDVNGLTGQNQWHILTKEVGTPKYFGMFNHPASPIANTVPQYLTQSFSMQNNIDMNKIKFKFSFPSNTLVDKQDYVAEHTKIELRLDNAGNPQTNSIYSITINDTKISNSGLILDGNYISSGNVDYVLEADMPYTLASGTTYWIVIDGKSTTTNIDYQTRFYTYLYDDGNYANSFLRNSSTTFANLAATNKVSNHVLLGDVNWESNSTCRMYLEVYGQITDNILPSDCELNATVDLDGELSATQALIDGNAGSGYTTFTDLISASPTDIAFDANLTTQFDATVNARMFQTDNSHTIDATYSINTTHVSWALSSNYPSFAVGTLQNNNRNASLTLPSSFTILTTNRGMISSNTITDGMTGTGSYIYTMTATSPNVITNVVHPSRVKRGMNIIVNIAKDTQPVGILAMVRIRNTTDIITSVQVGYGSNQSIAAVFPAIGEYTITVETISSSEQNMSRGFYAGVIEVYDTTSLSTPIYDSLNRRVPSLAVNVTSVRFGTIIQTTTDSTGLLTVASLEYGTYTISWMQDDIQVAINITVPFTQSRITSTTQYHFIVDASFLVVDKNNKPFAADVIIDGVTRTTNSSGYATFALREDTYRVVVIKDDAVLYNKSCSVLKGVNETFTLQTDIDAYPTETRFVMPLWGWFLIIGLVVISTGLVVWYKKVHPKIEADELAMREKYSEAANLLQDELDLRAVLIIESVTKQALISRLYQLDKTFNEDLVTGFLGAMNDWEGEIERDATKIGGLTQLQYKAFTITMIHGEKVIAIAISNVPIRSRGMRTHLDDVVRFIDKRFALALVAFNGHVTPFKTAENDVDRMIGIARQGKFLIDADRIKQASLPKDVRLLLANVVMAKRDQFRLREFIAVLLEQQIATDVLDACILVTELLNTNVLRLMGTQYQFI